MRQKQTTKNQSHEDPSNCDELNTPKKDDIEDFLCFPCDENSPIPHKKIGDAKAKLEVIWIDTDKVTTINDKLNIDFSSSSPKQINSIFQPFYITDDEK